MRNSFETGLVKKNPVDEKKPVDEMINFGFYRPELYPME